MRTGLIAIAAVCASIWIHAPSARAKEIFVAPDGIDSAQGTKAAPFLTIQRAQRQAAPGDTVFIRGGMYKMSESQIAEKKGVFARVTVLDKSGKADAPINYFAFPGETPVFDLTEVKPIDHRVSAFYVSASWIHLKGIEVVGVQVTITGHTQSICFENQGSDNIYEQLVMHDGMAIGIYSINGARNLFLNCDAYCNYDPVSENGKGGNVDGFGCHPRKGDVGNVFRGCRSWYNSDDGYDCINSAESVTFEHCWSFYNGLSPDGKRLADGNGFKAGGYGATPVERLPNPIPRHKVQFCLAVGNKANGFYSNHHIGGSDWINNTAYKNAVNYNMRCREDDNKTDVDGYGHVLVNNLGFASRPELAEIARDRCTLKNNYFDLDLKITQRDFQSLDESQLTAARQKDGSLPEIRFLHLSPGSKLIGAGTSPTDAEHNRRINVDLGAFQSSASR